MVFDVVVNAVLQGSEVGHVSVVSQFGQVGLCEVLIRVPNVFGGVDEGNVGFKAHG